MKRFNPFLVLLMLCAAAVLTACDDESRLCAGIPDGEYSVICQVAERLNTTPEAMAGILKVSNIAALSAEKYSAGEAMAFLEDVETFLVRAQTEGITYAAAHAAAVVRYQQMAPAARAAFSLIEGDLAVHAQAVTALNLSGYDYELLFLHLAKQRAIIAPFVAAAE